MIAVVSTQLTDMSVNSSRYPLIRISKSGEMRLKNKVGTAILKENAYEDRALNTKLDTLSKHQFRQDKYMTYRQLEFATKQVSASEERPRTVFSTESKNFEANDQVLPPLVTRRGSNMVASANIEERHPDNNGETVDRNKAKGRWEKALSLVREAVQNRNTLESTGRTETGQKAKPQKFPEVHSQSFRTNQLPPINVNESVPRETSSFRRKPPLRKQPSLPEMLRICREKSQNCLHDPRFMKLEQCLRQTSHSRDENLWRNSRINSTESISRISYTR